jgi:hypothetical protein
MLSSDLALVYNDLIERNEVLILHYVLTDMDKILLSATNFCIGIVPTLNTCLCNSPCFLVGTAIYLIIYPVKSPIENMMSVFVQRLNKRRKDI